MEFFSTQRTIFASGQLKGYKSQMNRPDHIANIKLSRKASNKNLFGAMDNLQEYISITVSLIAVIATAMLLNGVLSNAGLTLELILSYIFASTGFSMGMKAQNIFTAY